MVAVVVDDDSVLVLRENGVVVEEAVLRFKFYGIAEGSKKNYSILFRFYLRNPKKIEID